MAAHALILCGGWQGHEPRQVGDIIAGELRARSFQVQIADSLHVLMDVDYLGKFNLIVPIWTMGKLTSDQAQNLMAVVEAGTGIGGFHGGMCDAFRECPEYQFMTGGQFVAHPGGLSVQYNIHVTDPDHYITKGLQDFELTSEQYYLHVDPANHVLATTEFPIEDGPHAVNGKVQLPQLWTRHWGKGRVFFSALGHDARTLVKQPIINFTLRGLLWAARAEDQSV